MTWSEIAERTLASSQSKKQALTLWTGVPVLGFDALASTGYGPEAILVILSNYSPCYQKYVILYYANHSQAVGETGFEPATSTSQT